jgi:hypothetical protein
MNYFTSIIIIIIQRLIKLVECSKRPLIVKKHRDKRPRERLIIARSTTTFLLAS